MSVESRALFNLASQEEFIDHEADFERKTEEVKIVVAGGGQLRRNTMRWIELTC